MSDASRQPGADDDRLEKLTKRIKKAHDRMQGLQVRIEALEAKVSYLTNRETTKGAR
jgi:FtsZ-binding cell division protein ZapB